MTGEEGVMVPAELAGLVDRLLGYGLAVLEARNGTAPTVAGLEGLRVQLQVAASAASGRHQATVMTPARPSYLTVGEAAEQLGVTPRFVRQLAADGALRASKPGRDWQLDADGVEDRRRRWQEQRAA